MVQVAAVLAVLVLVGVLLLTLLLPAVKAQAVKEMQVV